MAELLTQDQLSNVADEIVAEAFGRPTGQRIVREITQLSGQPVDPEEILAELHQVVLDRIVALNGHVQNMNHRYRYPEKCIDRSDGTAVLEKEATRVLIGAGWSFYGFASSAVRYVPEDSQTIAQSDRAFLGIYAFMLAADTFCRRVAKYDLLDESFPEPPQPPPKYCSRIYDEFAQAVPADAPLERSPLWRELSRQIVLQREIRPPASPL